MMKKIKFALAAVVAVSALALNANGASAHGYHHGCGHHCGYGYHHNGSGHHHGGGCCGY